MNKGQQRKSEIQHALKNLIHEKGYASVTMKDIGTRLGLSVGGLYYHYHSVEEIFHDLMEHETQNVFDIFDDIEGFDDLMACLDRYFAGEKREFLSDVESINGVLYEYYFSFPEAERKQRMQESHQSAVCTMSGILSTVYTDHERIRRLAEHIFLTLHGLNMVSMCGGIEESLIDYEFNQIKEQLVYEYKAERKTK